MDLTFRFYSAESGGTLYLSVSQPGVAVSQGIYNVMIGSGTITEGTESTLAQVFQKHSEVWMGVSVNTDPEMTPRARISSVPFAMKAEKVDTAWLTAFKQASDFDGDGHEYSTDCDDGDPLVGPPSTW